MTHIYTEEGVMVPVTVVEAGPCLVLAVREKSVQVGFDAIKEKKLKKPQSGYFKKLNIACQRLIRDIKKDPGKEYKVGDELKADVFKPGDFVDVSGVSIGKGFQGGMKRWHWQGGPMTHGSTSHRRVGSMGSTTTPGRVWKGHHLPGHMGMRKATVQNLQIIKADAVNNILAIKGAVPGNNDNYLLIKTAIKKKVKVTPVVPLKTAKQPAKKK